MKKAIAWMLSLCMVLGLGPSVSAAAFPTGPFRDVASGSWYAPYITEACEAGIVTGITADTFAPAEQVTREMFLVMLLRAAGTDVAAYEGASPGFTDVPAGRWYSPYIACAGESGVIQGAGDDSFGLGAPVTREQMAVIMGRMLAGVQTEIPAGSAMEPWADSADISGWAADAAETMLRTGIMVGQGRSMFQPRKTATRAEAVAVVVRYLHAVENAEVLRTLPDAVHSVEVCTQSQVPPLRHLIPTEAGVADTLALIHSAEILRVEYIPPYSGWTNALFLYDADDNFLGAFDFSHNWIEIRPYRYYTADNYFDPLFAYLEP